MIKRKLDCVIKEDAQIDALYKKRELSDATENYSNDLSSCMLNISQLYCNKNINLILLYHMQDRVTDVDIFHYDVNKEKKKQWIKQLQKFIKKLKFDICKFKPSQLTEKIFILAQQNHNAVITVASIIRLFKQGDELKIDIIPVTLDTYSRSIYNVLCMQTELDDIAIDILCPERSGILIKSETIDISKFIEVIKLKISNIDNLVSIDEDIKNIKEVPSDNYKFAHQEIIDNYEIDIQANEGQYNDSSEDEIMDVVDHIKDTIEYEEIIYEVVDQVISRAVIKSNRKMHLGR